MSDEDTSARTDFGFRRVGEGEKAPLVRAIFDSVAERYDLMNDLMSAGIHRLWKNEMVAALKPRQGQRLLDVAGGTVDLFTVGFGLRNVTHIDRALAEARRVLKPGGRFLCLEFTPEITPLLQPLYDLYSFRIVPFLGQVVTGDRDAYAYLVESIRRFPRQSELAEMIARAGLDQVKFRNLTGGVAALHSAWRL